MYLIILSIVGTGLAKIMFNQLIQMSSPVFSTSVAYLIPIVAIIWGFIDGEKVSYLQLLAGVIILTGIYIVNKNSKNTRRKCSRNFYFFSVWCFFFL